MIFVILNSLNSFQLTLAKLFFPQLPGGSLDLRFGIGVPLGFETLTLFRTITT